MVKLENEPEPARPKHGKLAVIKTFDTSPADLKAAAVGAVQCPEDVQQGALPDAGHPDDSQNRATGNRKFYPAQDFEPAGWARVPPFDAARAENDTINLN